MRSLQICNDFNGEKQLSQKLFGGKDRDFQYFQFRRYSKNDTKSGFGEHFGIFRTDFVPLVLSAFRY